MPDPIVSMTKLKNTTEACLAAGGVRLPKSVKRLCPHGVAPATIVTVTTADYEERIKEFRKVLLLQFWHISIIKTHVIIIIRTLFCYPYTSLSIVKWMFKCE